MIRSKIISQFASLISGITITLTDTITF